MGHHSRPVAIKTIIREYYKKLYTNKFDNLEKINSLKITDYKT